MGFNSSIIHIISQLQVYIQHINEYFRIHTSQLIDLLFILHFRNIDLQHLSTQFLDYSIYETNVFLSQQCQPHWLLQLEKYLNS